jgi:protein phosphatase-4 regulatory subunit 3
MLHLQMRSAFARDRVVEHILTEEYIKNLLGVFEQAEDLESLEDLHTLHDVMQNIILLNDNSILEYVLQDEIFEGVIGMLEYDRDFPSIKTSFRQLFREISKFRQVVEIWDVGIRNKIHQTYRLQYLKEVVLSRVLDDSIFNILNGFIFFNQVDIIGHLVQNDDILVELFAYFKDGQDEAKQRDAVLFLHQLMLMSKVIQLANRVALYRALSEKGLTSVIEWAFQRQEAAIVHAAAEMLTIKAEHDSLGLRRQIVQDNDAKRPQTLMTVIIRLHERTSNTGLLSQLTDVIRVLLEPPADNDVSDFCRPGSSLPSVRDA